jgi:hypothetical protein
LIMSLSTFLSIILKINRRTSSECDLRQNYSPKFVFIILKIIFERQFSYISNKTYHILDVFLTNDQWQAVHLAHFGSFFLIYLSKSYNTKFAFLIWLAFGITPFFMASLMI